MTNLNLDFKIFVENNKNFMSDVKETMLKIPKRHAKLVKNYKFHSEKGNTLKGDAGHVGEIDEKTKKIKVAGPWHYGREFCILHEIGHAVWKYLVDSKARKKWSELFKSAKKQDKDGLDQNEEESFCMIYAQHYAKNKLMKYDHPELQKFIDKLPN